MGDLTALFFLVFLVIAGLLAFQLLLRQQQVAELRRSGQRVVAGVTRVIHERVQTNAGATIPGPPGMPPTPAPSTFADRWYIECRWTDPKTRYSYTFRSDAVDHSTAALYAPGAPITVLMQPGDPETYYVEVAG